MRVEIVFTGNGPGELSGWVRPVARATRDVAKERGIDLRMTMALTPSQFATGHEADVIRTWSLFDRIILPAESVRLAVGLGRLTVAGAGALVHLGGDLWFSARLSAKSAIPACALAETTHVARRHRAFSQLFATSDEVAERLEFSGVPREKVLVTGDPRIDGVPEINDRPSTIDHRYIVSFMPSSRDDLFAALVPYFLNVAEQLRREERVHFQMVVSPFLPAGVIERAREDARRTHPHLDVKWMEHDQWFALSQSDFVLTVPGTNTVELAASGMPFAAIAPYQMIDHLRLEGLANWITRLPFIGRPIKRAVALRALSNQRFIALPNQRAGRLVAPEWIGTWPEEAFVAHLRQLLYDRRRRADMGAALRGLYAGARGASRRIAERSLSLAGGVTA